MRRAAGTCLAARGGVALRCVGSPLESLGAVSSNLMARRRGLLLIRRAGALREATTRAPFHLRGKGENSSDDGACHLQQPHRVGVAGGRLNVDYRNQEESFAMGEVIELRPLVLGYARLAPFAGHGQHTMMQGQFASYAHGEGLQLGTIYFERTGSAPHFEHSDEAPAFADLVAAIQRSRARGVVVPSLSAFGEQKDKRVAELEDVLGVVVYTVDVHDPRD